MEAAHHGCSTLREILMLPMMSLMVLVAKPATKSVEIPCVASLHIISDLVRKSVGALET